jgi:hypothetical protein
MSKRVYKRKSDTATSTQRRHRLATNSSVLGIPMPKCSRCLEKGLDCTATGSSKRCGPCNRANCSSCDVWGIDPATFRSFISEKEQLDREKQETLAKLLRLESQSRSLEERVKQAMSRELRDISELEREEASSVPAPSSAADAPPVNSSNADPLPSDPSWIHNFSSDDPFLAGVDLSVGLPLVGPDSSGGTPGVSRGS